MGRKKGEGRGFRPSVWEPSLSHFLSTFAGVGGRSDSCRCSSSLQTDLAAAFRQQQMRIFVSPLLLVSFLFPLTCKQIA